MFLSFLTTAIIAQLNQAPQITEQPVRNLGPSLAPQLAQVFNQASDFVLNFNYANLVSNIKIIGIVLTILFAAALVYIFIKIQGLLKIRIAQMKGELNPPEQASSPYDARWQEVRNHVNSFNVAEWKFAVIEADKLIDDALKSSGFKGETMGERLTLITHDQIPEIQNLWEAHKLRNLLVHDTSFELDHNMAIAAIDVFERVLEELGAIN